MGGGGGDGRGARGAVAGGSGGRRRRRPGRGGAPAAGVPRGGGPPPVALRGAAAREGHPQVRWMNTPSSSWDFKNTRRDSFFFFYFVRGQSCLVWLLDEFLGHLEMENSVKFVRNFDEMLTCRIGY